MADTITPELRSKNMSAIKSQNTKPELYIRSKLFARGYRYRLHSSKIEGRPDIYLKRYNVAIFIHGCYWHRHPSCKYAYMPKSNIEFWNNKFQSNIQRDHMVLSNLRESGIRVLIIWECTIRQMMRSAEQEQLIIMRIDSFLNSDNLFMEL